MYELNAKCGEENQVTDIREWPHKQVHSIKQYLNIYHFKRIYSLNPIISILPYGNILEIQGKLSERR